MLSGGRRRDGEGSIKGGGEGKRECRGEVEVQEG